MQYQIVGQKIVQIPTEPITMIDFQVELAFFEQFYRSHGVKIPRNFAKVFRDLWHINQQAILNAVQKYGYDCLLLNLPTRSVAELDEQMTSDGRPTRFWIDVNRIREHRSVKHPRLVLMHSKPDLRDHPILKATLRQTAKSFLDSGVRTTFSDYRVFQEVIQQIKGYMPETWGWNLCPGSRLGTRAGAAVVHSYWNLNDARLSVNATSLGRSDLGVGCRPSSCFYRRG